ncbi:MAG: L-threonylcarbamoyladenylate synthase [Faecousia sp.]
MNTLQLSAEKEEDIALAAKLLREGKLVAIPTETVYGLGANGLDEEAVARIFEAKGRPQDNPLILHISEPKELSSICHDIPQTAWLLAEHFWPGPLTMVLPVRDLVPKRTTAGLDTVAVRCPKTEATRRLIALAGVPIAAPSANRSGKPSTTTAAHVLHDMDGRIEAILDGGACEVGVESTIIDLTGERPRLLRPGGITPEQLTALLGEIDIDRAVLGQISNDAVVRAPGMKYKHYAPSAEVYIIQGSSEAAARYIRKRFQSGDAVLCFKEELPLYEGCNPTAYGSRDDVLSLSAGLFAALRDLDTPEIKTIYARCPEGGGVAYAVGNRLKKAAAFRTVNAEEEP